MTKRQFTDAERYAVYAVHGERCYMCLKPVDLLTMEVDHVIPKALRDEPDRLAEVLALFGLPEDFNLESFENWLPSCRTCNNRKRDLVFQPTPRVQVNLQVAGKRASEAAALAAAWVSDRAVSKAWNTIKRAHAARHLPENLLAELREFGLFHARRREPEVADQPMCLAPSFKILSEKDGLRIVRGPYGIGAGPIQPANHLRCPSCGSAVWNGARCVVCGAMDDD